MMKARNYRWVNKAVTERIDQLHHAGYRYDFSAAAGDLFLCVQTDTLWSYQQISVRLVGHYYDSLRQGYCFLHTVETDTGENGILLIPADHGVVSREKDMSRLVDAIWEAL